MAELWAVVEFNPIGFTNPNKSGDGLKIRSLYIQKVIIQNFSSSGQENLGFTKDSVLAWTYSSIVFFLAEMSYFSGL